MAITCEGLQSKFHFDILPPIFCLQGLMSHTPSPSASPPHHPGECPTTCEIRHLNQRLMYFLLRLVNAHKRSRIV